MENFYVVPPSSPPPTHYSPNNTIDKSSSEGTPASYRHPERIAPLRERAAAANSTLHSGSNPPLTSGAIGSEKVRGTPVKRAKWHLGI